MDYQPGTDYVAESGVGGEGGEGEDDGGEGGEGEYAVVSLRALGAWEWLRSGEHRRPKGRAGTVI